MESKETCFYYSYFLKLPLAVPTPPAWASARYCFWFYYLNCLSYCSNWTILWSLSDCALRLNVLLVVSSFLIYLRFYHSEFDLQQYHQQHTAIMKHILTLHKDILNRNIIFLFSKRWNWVKPYNQIIWFIGLNRDLLYNHDFWIISYMTVMKFVIFLWFMKKSCKFRWFSEHEIPNKFNQREVTVFHTVFRPLNMLTESYWGNWLCATT